MKNRNPLRLGAVLWTVVMLLCCACLPGTALSATSDDALSRMEERRRGIAERMGRSTVFIMAVTDDSLGMGTGFVVADGYVMTNAHVVDGTDTWYVANDELPPVRAQLIKQVYDESAGADFALLRIPASPSLPALSFNTQVGRMDRVSAWGYPFLVTKFDRAMEALLEEGNFESMPPLVYTEGVVSTLVRGANSRSIIHTAAIAGGNSGGPLINSWGEVVGINTWGATAEDEGAFVNASLPADQIVAFLRSCGIEPQLSQRSSSPVQTALAPNLSIPSSPPSAEGSKAPPRSIAPATKGTPGSLPPDLSAELQDIWYAASQGNAEAQAAVGYAYYSGEGAPQDTAIAVSWLQKAAEQDNNEANYLLGIVYIYEDEYKKVPDGLELLHKAADADPDYASTLAMLYLDGEIVGVERDSDLSAAYAQRGADAGDADAVAVLSFLTYFGVGVEQNIEEALQLARQAGKEENALALAVLGWIYYSGEVVPVNIPRALSFATDAAESEEAHAMGLLAFMYYYGDDKLQPDMEKAEGWAMRAAELCNEYGQYVLGMIYKEQKSEQKQVEAWAYLDMSARYLVSAEEERDALTKKLSPAQRKAAKELSAKWLGEFGLPPNA